MHKQVACTAGRKSTQVSGGKGAGLQEPHGWFLFVSNMATPRANMLGIQRGEFAGTR